MKPSILTILFLLIVLPNFGQIEIQHVCLVEHVANTPALSAILENSTISAHFTDEFCTKKLLSKSLFANVNIKKNHLLLYCSHWGWKNFGNFDFRLGYARKFGRHVSIAVQAVYWINHATNYSHRHSFTIDLSSAFQVTPKLLLTTHLFNPIHLHYEIIGKEIIPMYFSIKAQYKPRSNFLAHFTIEKEIPGNFNAGITLYYKTHPKLIIQGNSSLTNCGFGFFILPKKMIIHISTQWFYKISFSPECNFHYLF